MSRARVGEDRRWGPRRSRKGLAAGKAQHKPAKNQEGGWFERKLTTSQTQGDRVQAWQRPGCAHRPGCGSCRGRSAALMGPRGTRTEVRCSIGASDADAEQWRSTPALAPLLGSARTLPPAARGWTSPQRDRAEHLVLPRRAALQGHLPCALQSTAPRALRLPPWSWSPSNTSFVIEAKTLSSRSRLHPTP